MCLQLCEIIEYGGGEPEQATHIVTCECCCILVLGHLMAITRGLQTLDFRNIVEAITFRDICSMKI